jgi:hypothetical protein
MGYGKVMRSSQADSINVGRNSKQIFEFRILPVEIFVTDGSFLFYNVVGLIHECIPI